MFLQMIDLFLFVPGSFFIMKKWPSLLVAAAIERGCHGDSFILKEINSIRWLRNI